MLTMDQPTEFFIRLHIVRYGNNIHVDKFWFLTLNPSSNAFDFCFSLQFISYHVQILY